ncbi:hypothetical protein BGW41_005032 [Actinomortierella wolfii]|nr:hypothetical protein BGW41_005032 [Actinomortierella wolfii]
MSSAASSSQAHTSTLDDGTVRTLTSISIVHARPEHLHDIHNIQLICYKDSPEMLESIDVFRSKLEHYPAGNFVALATYSVVSRDDPTTWSSASEKGDDDGGHDDQHMEGVEQESQGHQGESEAMDEDPRDQPHHTHGKATVRPSDDFGEADRDVQMDVETGLSGSGRAPSTVEIVITDLETPSPSSSPASASHQSTEKVTILRARTPDISIPDSDDDADELENKGDHHGQAHYQKKSAAMRSSPHKDRVFTARIGGKSKTTTSHATEDEVDGDEEPVIVLAQWEKPIGYLLSHPFTRETATIHKILPMSTAASTGAGAGAPQTTVRTKKTRLNQEEGGSDVTAAAETAEASTHHKSPEPESTIEEVSELDDQDDLENDRFEHDPSIEQYFLHDMAILPEFQGQGLAYLLYKALEDSLTPSTSSTSSTLAPSSATESRQKPATTTTVTTTTKSGYTVTTTQRWNRRGAPNLKELHLVSVQGTRQFWENRPKFRVVTDHDLDLSAYGKDAYYMKRPFHL